jgi:FAD:protein FMN transferase
MGGSSAWRRQGAGFLAKLGAWLGLALLLGLAACARPQLTQQESFVFGTQVQVTVAGVPEAQANSAVAAVLAEFDRLHHLLHAWRPSEITRLNEAIAAGQSHAVPAEVAGLLREAQAMAAASDYLFDPGIGRLIALWGFQSDEFVPRLPDLKALAEWQRERPSIGDLRLDGNIVSSRKRTVSVDLGGYAKGVALDRAATILRSKGVNNALINIGGNVLALGSKNGVPWRIGIKHPRQSGHLATLELRDGEAIGTSGDYQRYFELDGARYSHLLDPRSGRPAVGTQAVTILIPVGGASPIGTGTRSDALSKPLFVAGSGAWREMARRVGVTHALRIDDAGRVEVSEAFAARLEFAMASKDIERFR